MVVADRRDAGGDDQVGPEPSTGPVGHALMRLDHCSAPLKHLDSLLENGPENPDHW